MDSNKQGKRVENTVKKTYKIAVAVTSVTQTAMSLLVPLFIFIFGARYLTNRFNLPPFVNILGIILGVVCGFYSSFRYIIAAARVANKDREE